MDNPAEQKVDLNTAVPRDLAKLPGVDRLLARRIVLDRKLYGAFQSLEDLERVEGVSPRLVETLANQVEVGSTAWNTAAGRLCLVPREKGPKDQAAVVFAGTPELIRGTVVLRNDGEGMLHGAVVRIENTTLQSADGLPMRRVMLPGPLGPGQQRATTVTFALDPHTPPATYKVDLVAGRDRHPAIVVVGQRYSLTMTPSRLAILNEPGGKSEHQVVVRNEGNVAIIIDDVGGVGLEEIDLECRVIRATVRHTKHPTWDEVIGTAADELKRTFAQFELLRVRVKNKPVRIEPGATVVLTLQIQIPKQLPARRRYRGRYRSYDSSLTFELEPRLDGQETEAE